MRNPGFVENETNGAKAHGLIKTDDRHLGVQINLPRAQGPGRRHGSLQQRCSHTSPSPALQHRHAPDLRIAMAYDQPRRSDRFFYDSRQKVNRSFVISIQLHFRRHALFLHENTHANGKSLVQVCFGRNFFDSNRVFHSRAYALDVLAMQG